MNKYKKIFAIITVLLFVTGCDSFLEEEPKALLSPSSFYETVDDLRTGVNSIYLALYANRGSMPGGQRSYQMHIGADDVTTLDNGKKTQWLTVDQMNPSSSLRFIEIATYQIPYAVIYQCNNIIEVSGQIEGDQKEIDELVALAYFWRGWAHFYATRFYNDIPIKLTTLSEPNIARSPVIDVYKQIESDFEEALKSLPDTWGNNAAYPDSYALKTLMADFYITWAGWPLKDTSKYAVSASYAQQAMDKPGAALLDNYSDLWLYDVLGTYDSHSEVIWNIVFATDDQAGDQSRARAGARAFVQAELQNGFSDFFSEIGFFNRFPEGPRKDATFITEVEVGGNTLQWEDNQAGHPFYAKYRGSYDNDNRQQNTGQDFMIYRYADVLLLYAEAKAMSSGGPDASAYEAINQVRRRAEGLPVNTPNISVDLVAGLDQIAFRDKVIDERSWEFAAEARRWYDLVRTEKVQEAVDGKDANDNQTGASTPLLDTYLFPLPLQELLINTNDEGFKQNLGYE